MNTPTVWIFTDFDGCLHPSNCPREARFSRMAHLANVMRRYPFVRVVVASSWRLKRSLDDLRGFFPTDVREQVAGGTPDLNLNAAPFQRYQEVAAFLAKIGTRSVPWIAIEDDPDQYPLACRPNMVMPDPSVGLTEALEARICELVERLSSSRSTAPPAPSYRIRNAQLSDMRAVARIYGHFVLTSRATFEEVPPTAEEMERRFGAINEKQLPYLIAETDMGVLLGYVYATPYRSRAAYRFTVENSVYVDHSLPHHGIGTALMRALIERCDAGPWRQMIAVIGDSENRASIGLHYRMGFSMIGTAKAVGWKFGGWVDTVLMQRELQGKLNTNRRSA